MENDILGLVIYFCVQDNHYEWVRVCKNWNKIGTKLVVFEKRHTTYDLSVFLKTLTMNPWPSCVSNFFIECGELKYKLDYEWRCTENDNHWYFQGLPVPKIILIKGEIRFFRIREGKAITAVFFNEKLCQEMFAEMLKMGEKITIKFKRGRIGNNYLIGYRLIDDLVSKKNISISICESNLGAEHISFNVDDVLSHYKANKEMYFQFAKEHQLAFETQKKEFNDHRKKKRNSYCSIL